MENIINEEILEEDDEVLTDLEIANSIRDALEELNSLRAEIYERGYVTVFVGEDNIQIYKEVREEI